MSDAEENPLEETEGSGEAEMEEEEDNPNYKEVENMQQKAKEDTSAPGESQEEEEGVEGEEIEVEEEERVKEKQRKEKEMEVTEEEEGEKEEGGKEKDKKREEEEIKGEREEERAKEEREEEEKLGEEKELEEAVIEKTEEKVGEAQEEAPEVQGETTEELQESFKITLNNIISTSQLTTSGSSSDLSEGSRSQRSNSPETSALLRDVGSQILDVDQIQGEEEQASSEPLEEKTYQWPQDELGHEGRDEVQQGGVEAAKDERGQRSEKGGTFQYGTGASVQYESLVTTSTEDTLFQKEEVPKVYPLTMTWSFGWNSTLPVYYIRDENHRVLLYVSGHTAVIYNAFRNSQYHLQGHPNIISCICVSEDKRWIATADKGPDCLIIIWDSFTGIPVHTIFDSCPEGNGMRAIAMTRDAKYLATISDAEIQKVCIWKWTLAIETPSCTLELPKEYGFQNYLTFNPTNNKELVSNSKTQAIYYSWFEEKEMLSYSAPLLTEKTFNKLVGKFSQSVFHLNLTQILSATMEGKLVVWDIYRPPSSSSTFSFPYIKPCKLVHLQKEGITVLTTVDSFLVTGDIKGNIKFYDSTLSIVNWYSNFKLSAIRTLSFSKTPASPPTEKSNLPQDCTLKGDFFVVRNFIIGTYDATVYHLTTDGTKLEKLFVEPKDAVCAIACHPYQPLFALGSICGIIKVWDYENKKYLFSRAFGKGLGVQSLTYNPEGKTAADTISRLNGVFFSTIVLGLVIPGALLGAGFTEGTVYILDAMSLENESPEPFKYSKTSVTHVSFSHDSQYMATADVSFTVSVYMVVVKNRQRVWEYLARLRSHRSSIRSLLFGVYLDSNEPRLLSLGKDRFLIEYNLIKSYKDHLEVLDIHRTDQGNYPTCMVWYPPLTKELFLLICNSGYKVKLFNSTTKMCRKTLLGPAYGSPIEHTQVLPVRTTLELQKRYLVFINKDKVGLQILPVDGNPHKTCAIVCHPSGVAGMAISYDGSYAFTAGGEDRSVVQWKINLSALEAAVSLGGEDLTPFYGLVSGGREGKFYRELEDYFYYSQLRSQGIDTMETRKVSEYICLSELPFVMRAIGFYPSEEQIDDMFNEIKFSEYVDTGDLIDKINLPDFFKVYLNHRPPFGNTMSGIQESFNVLGYTNSEGKKAVQREDFLKLLLTKGEHMTEEEMEDCFATLFGLNPEGWKSEPQASSVRGSEICLEEELPEEITAEIFATEILGLTISDSSGQHGQ